MTANGQPAVIVFSPSVAAFGVDLLEYQGFSETATVTVCATDGTTVLYTSAGVPVAGPTPVFFGYQPAGGIGRVQIAAATRSWAPMVDNLTFGQLAAAAPSAIPALGAPGLLALALALGVAGLWLTRRLGA